MQVFSLLGRRLNGRAVPEICMLVMQFVPVQMMCGVAGAAQFGSQMVMPVTEEPLVPLTTNEMPFKYDFMMPATEEPPAKRQRTDGLLREDDFIEANPMDFTLAVVLPTTMEKYGGKMVGQTLQLAVQLTDKVSTLKAKIQAEFEIPPGKQTLKVGTTVLNNCNSLAFYNITAGKSATLTEKIRGGRK